MNRNYLILSLLFISHFSTIIYNPLKAQEIVWQNTIGGSGQDYLRTMDQTADGGFICGGRSDSDISGDKSENSRGANDYWIVKLDASGNVEWEKTIGGSGQDYLMSILQSSDGGYLCGGYSNSVISGDKTEPNLGSNDYWVVKLDAFGNIQWQNTIGGSAEDKLSAIVNTPDGGFVCAGASLSHISGDKSDTCNGGYDYWLVKLDANGIIQWQNTIGGTSSDYLNTLAATSDGGYICGGNSASGISADKTEACQGNTDYWIVKVDSIGNIQWQNTIGAVFYDELHSINEIPGGGYICGGFSNSPISGDKTDPNIGGGHDDMWLLRLDVFGDILWQNAIGGVWDDFLYDVKPDSDGGFLCTGWSNNSGSGIYGDQTELTLGGGYDIWVVKLDSAGLIQWQNLIGGIYYDQAFAAQPLMDGTYVIGGLSSSPVSHDKTEASQGNMDYWVMKLTSKFNLIKGTNYVDMNFNNIRDAGEISVNQQRVSEITSGRFAFSNNIGNYSIAILDTGSYTVTAPPMNYFAPGPASNNAYFNAMQQVDSLNDFAYAPAGSFNDLCITITPLGAFRSGFMASYLINYSNVGTTTLNPTVIFYADPNVTFSTAFPAPALVSSDSAVWSFGPMSPFQSGQILVIVNVNLGLPIGTLINSSAKIEPIAGDANPGCNHGFWEVFTIGSWDPNDILVNYDTLTTTQVANNQFLEFIIRFQNTGNDTAFTVKILNPIDIVQLNLSTFELINSSHPVSANWINWERNMEFKFENILLPDSNTNEPESHGFVRYRIHPVSGITAGNTIENFALIYFDFNSYVQTNIAETEIILPTSLDENLTESSNKIVLYPNPAQDEVTIEWQSKDPALSDVVFYNLYGQEVIIHPSSNANANSNKQTLNITKLPAGIYFVKTSTSNAIKFVKL